MDSIKNISRFTNDDDSYQKEAAAAAPANISAHIKTFTLDSAYEQIGGFGIFQLLAVISLTIIRNFGSVNVYMFALSTAEMPYLCRNND